jgi:hypothetical protein
MKQVKLILLLVVLGYFRLKATWMLGRRKLVHLVRHPTIPWNYARNAWPTTGAGSLSTGVLASGVTTIRWGTKGIGQNTGWLTVLRFAQKTMAENIKLPNGDGVTATRVLIVDGQQWDLTVRDDTAIVPPQVGDSVTVVDAGGLIGGTAADAVKTYTATVVDSGFDTAPKQAGERVITVENLLLVESQTAGTQS